MTIKAERDLYKATLKDIARQGRLLLGRCIAGKDCSDVHCMARRALRKAAKRA